MQARQGTSMCNTRERRCFHCNTGKDLSESVPKLKDFFLKKKKKKSQVKVKPTDILPTGFSASHASSRWDWAILMCRKG